jgi:hypothetical protein
MFGWISFLHIYAPTDGAFWVSTGIVMSDNHFSLSMLNMWRVVMMGLKIFVSGSDTRKCTKIPRVLKRV